MELVVVMLLFGLILGLAAVASNPSPYFGALGLVVAAGMGCGILAEHGGTFLSLILFLIYLGGMLVVFAYSVALAAEPYPEDWFSLPVLGLMMFYLSVVLVCAVGNWEGWSNDSWALVHEYGDLMLGCVDVEGVTSMYSDGFVFLLVGGGALLLTLFVVLELVRGVSRGALRAV
uniref:NADH-ubiquinone oxidoreductase chain 6 n=1 Tax=Pictichromis paccagnellae TaxID=586861 RepID=A0A0U3KNR3_9TELE|nr:NADH dehydrogenase subunit 6 [Pictichromis paccagnellae]ALV90041.1 NADH dehydrogenase subunit 6 [Pictichromis paccagnellae]